MCKCDVQLRLGSVVDGWIMYGWRPTQTHMEFALSEGVSWCEFSTRKVQSLNGIHIIRRQMQKFAKSQESLVSQQYDDIRNTCSSDKILIYGY